MNSELPYELADCLGALCPTKMQYRLLPSSEISDIPNKFYVH